MMGVLTLNSYLILMKCLLQAAINNVTQCCIEQNVSSSCQDACTFFLDIDAVIDKPECINDFHKLMKCAAGRPTVILLPYLQYNYAS